VDIRQDQIDRFDNRTDVLTKTFLGLTVSCAGCHERASRRRGADHLQDLDRVTQMAVFRLLPIQDPLKTPSDLW